MDNTALFTLLGVLLGALPGIIGTFASNRNASKQRKHEVHCLRMKVYEEARRDTLLEFASVLLSPETTTSIHYWSASGRASVFLPKTIRDKARLVGEHLESYGRYPPDRSNINEIVEYIYSNLYQPYRDQ